MRQERWEEWEGPIVDELTHEDIKQQDFIDNTIHNMLCDIARTKVPWDTEIIQTVLDTARKLLWERYRIRIPYAEMEVEKE